MAHNNLNVKDSEIIRLLKENARMTYSEIGEVVGLSRTAVKNRVTALEEAGIIKGYRAVIEPFASPGMMSFVLNIETAPEHFNAAREYLVNSDLTLTVLQTTGRSHLVAICLAKDVQDMRQCVNNIYKSLAGVQYVNAQAVIDVAKGSIMPD